MNQRDLILSALDGAFKGPGWQGPTLMSSLRRLSPAAATRSIRGRKAIWQQLLHAAYWKHRILRKFTGNKSSRFPRRAINWAPTPKPADTAAWRADLQMLRDLHEQLRSAVARAPVSKLTPKNLWLLYGIAAHDVYHAGQINLLRRLLGVRS
jgi:uncharacterized damage-inducible protein DinB